MNKDDALEYTQSLGQITGGAWRQIALAKRLGVHKALGVTLDQWVKQLGGYTKLSIDDRREAVAELKAEGESNREIAAVLGVAEGTVRNDASAQNYAPEESEEPESRANTWLEEAEKTEGAQNYAPQPNALDALAFAEASAGGGKQSDVLAALHTGDEESYTPAEYIESARAVMGRIDLDPASNALAQKTVRASRFFTADDDGLAQPWNGCVWMNPPYTALVINRFIDRLLEHYAAGDVEQAIMLTNNNTDTSWWHEAQAAAAGVCFTAGRINFVKRDGSRSSPTNGQNFFYFGNRFDSFHAEFSKYGAVMVKA